VKTGPVNTADTIVIGAGLHGCSAALHLAMRGQSVIVLEKDHAGRHASGVNAGGVRRLGRALPEVPLSVASAAMWHEIESLVDDDCGFVASCQIKVADCEAALSQLRARAAQLRHLGFEHEEIIDRDTMRDLLPAIAPDCVGAMMVRGDGAANPYRTVQAFRRKGMELGVVFHQGHGVKGISQKAGNWRVQTPRASYEAATLVNTAGAWGARIAAMVGDVVPLEARAPMLMITAPMPPFVDGVVVAQGHPLSFKQFKNGTVLIGGGHMGTAWPDSNRTDLDLTGLAKSAATAIRFFPIMKKARVVRSWAGIEGYLPDDIPVIGAGRADNVFHGFGYSAHGFQLGPVGGRILSDLVVDGSTDLPIEAFSCTRFGALTSPLEKP
jgi:glycine/D-amino acid oxidase-like deaminating enzyme